MKKHNIIKFAYIRVFIFAVLLCRDITEIDSGYHREIEKYTYQLSYASVYSRDFPTQQDESRETVAEAQVKTAYLTFDDGPSPRTEEILDILKKQDIKATFFVIKAKDDYTPYLQRAAEEGHTIGVHSSSHKYNLIYKSVDAYLEDFTECYDYIYNSTGCIPTIFRFPGGSVNNHNSATRKAIVDEMSRRGFIYFDWNVESNDSLSGQSADTICNNVINGCKGRQRAVIIMHDSIGKKTTVEALEKIITQLKSEGWVFKALDNRVKPMIFKMK